MKITTKETTHLITHFDELQNHFKNKSDQYPLPWRIEMLSIGGGKMTLETDDNQTWIISKKNFNGSIDKYATRPFSVRWALEQEPILNFKIYYNSKKNEIK